MDGLLLSVPFAAGGGGNDTGAACLATGVTGLDDAEIDDSMGEEETAHPPGDPFPVELFLNEDLEKLFFTGTSLLLPLLGDEGGDALPFIVTLLDGMEAAVDELLLLPPPIPPPLTSGVDDPTILLSDTGVDDFILNDPLAKLFFTGTTLSLLPPIMLLLAE